MDIQLRCDFIFGEKVGDLKEMDYKLLNGFKKKIQRQYFLVFGRKLYYEKGALAYLKRGRYDIIFITGETPSLTFWLLLLRLLFSRKKIVAWGHGYYGNENWIKKQIKRLMFAMCDYYLLYGNYARDLLIKNHIAPARKLITIYNSLDYDTQICERQKLKLENFYQEHFNNNNPNLIFIGRLTSVKKLDMILHAIFELKSKKKEFNLIIIGTGKQEELLKILVKQLGIENNVWFYGECYEESLLSRLIYNADLCVSPGNVGLTAIHSLMYGTPVITHNNFQYQMPEFEAIEAGKTGTFFEHNNVASLGMSINKWVENVSNREIIRKNCYKVIDEKYNPHVQIEIINRLVNKL